MGYHGNTSWGNLEKKPDFVNIVKKLKRTNGKYYSLKKIPYMDLASFTKAKEISGNNLKALRTKIFWENFMLREELPVFVITHRKLMSANHPVKRSPSLLCVLIWESVRSDDSCHCKDFVGGSESQKSSWSQEVYLFGESCTLIRDQGVNQLWWELLTTRSLLVNWGVNQL